MEELFCIDTYEASRPDSTVTEEGVDGSRAVVRKGVRPWMTYDNAVADAACRASDKRLCEPAEWEFACAGPDEQVYAYGDEYVAETCNGIDTFGRSRFRLMPTGSFPDCTNEYGVFDMNGNVWEHVAGGDGSDVRGGAYNCGDSVTLHKCSYIPGNWNPSAQGFRCCRDPNFGRPDKVEAVETVEAVDDTFEPADGWIDDIASSDLTESYLPDLPVEDICGPGDTGRDFGTADVFADVPVDVFLDVLPVDDGPPDLPVSDELTDAGTDAVTDAGTDAVTDVGTDAVTDVGTDAVSFECPQDMCLVSYPFRTPFCMDRYEASRSDATATSYGTSTVPVSQPGRLPWMSSSVTATYAASACASAGKRLCSLDEWYGACVGSADTVYVYGDDYAPEVCNGIDTFCYCDTTCSTVAECPYPHCRVQASPAGDGGPCGASFHVAVTGSFPACVNEWGVFDVNGNVWEVVDAGDSLNHFRGGAYNCGDSEALHRCDHDGTWNPSAKGFRCCLDLAPAGGGY